MSDDAENGRYNRNSREITEQCRVAVEADPTTLGRLFDIEDALHHGDKVLGVHLQVEVDLLGDAVVDLGRGEVQRPGAAAITEQPVVAIAKPNNHRMAASRESMSTRFPSVSNLW